MSIKEEIKVKAAELLGTIKEIVKEGNVRRIIIKDEKGIKYLEIPVTIGVVGVILAPFLAAIAALAVLTTELTIEVIREEDD
jgi:ribosomal 30S subunit maturation factor RimM